MINLLSPPVLAWHGTDDHDTDTALVVLLHGRGSNENDIIALAERLPEGPSYVAVRAPMAEGAGFAWFANRGIGRPMPDSLSATMAWFRTWLDAATSAERPVLLIGFSGGAAFAGGLILDDPSRYAGAAILSGTLPFDAGVPTTPDRLAGLPVLVAQGDSDNVIPRTLLDRTWHYLTTESGATTSTSRDPGGHGISARTLTALQQWLTEHTTTASDSEV